MINFYMPYSLLLSETVNSEKSNPPYWTAYIINIFFSYSPLVDTMLKYNVHYIYIYICKRCIKVCIINLYVIFVCVMLNIYKIN